jgi:phosphoribosylanthranilate isomerase
VLAGGLTPRNVAEAIRATGVTAVDTASGVESRPGHKDPEAVAKFVLAARAAFAAS